MEDIVYLNGDLIPISDAKISPLDHGFLYGYGLFETMRAYNGTIFHLDQHLIRLQKSAETLNLASQIIPSELKKACYDALNANKLVDARIRITISAGEGALIPNPASCHNITIFIVAQKLIVLPSKKYENGFKTILSSWRRNSQSPLSKLKSTCYLENVLAKQEVTAVGADEALILNEQGHLCEGSTTNIFLVHTNTLVTPSIESGALPGITRAIILELAHTTGIKAIERVVKPAELINADEAFLTNSIIEIMPLTLFANNSIGNGKPGTLTRNLMSMYRRLVKEEIRTQSMVKGNSG